jgi:hypothetical protein
MNRESAPSICPEKLIYLHAFLMQIASWEEIERTGQLPEYAYRYLHGTRIQNSNGLPGSIVDLLVRNRNEWKSIVAERRARGFQWARLLDRAPLPVGQGFRHASA